MYSTFYKQKVGYKAVGHPRKAYAQNSSHIHPCKTMEKEVSQRADPEDTKKT